MNESLVVNIFLAVGVIFSILGIYIYFLRRTREKLEHGIAHNVEIFEKSCEHSKNATLILASQNKIIYANKSMLTLLDAKKKLQGEIWQEIPQIQVRGVWYALDTFISKQPQRESQSTLVFPQIILKLSQDKEMEIDLHLSRLLLAKGSAKYYDIITIYDLTQKHASATMAHKHKLTQLPNQLQAQEDIPSLFAKIHAQKNKIAFVLMGFDNYAKLRAIIGYEESNEVIIQFSHYLKNIISDMHISVYHTFDNHFLLILTNVESDEQVTALVREIQIKLTTLYKVDNVSLRLTFSAGIALYPDSGSTATLLDNTYKSLAQAQNYGDGKINVYRPNKSKTEYDETILHNDMEEALKRGDFEVYYQPIVSIPKEEIVAAEALIRWIHPKYGMIPPDHFIALMEKTGFIVKLGQFIVHQVLTQQKHWETFGFKQIEVSINVSMVEIATGDYVQNVARQLKHHDVSPTVVKFEITEGMAMIGETQTQKYFNDLKALGVKISLDDFGTGYTSFSYLKKFPADVIKIDKSLIDYILTSVEDQRIVHAIIDLGHNLGMQIVVEGIESREMVDMVTSFGCDYIQGYYFSKPLPALEFQKLIRKV